MMIYKCLTGLAATLMLASCTFSVGSEGQQYWYADVPDDPDEENYMIVENGQITYQDLRIGADSFAIDTYEDAEGQMISGMRAGLWFFFRDTPEHDFSRRVYPGQIIQAGDYQIRIHSLTRHENGQWTVELGIQD